MGIFKGNIIMARGSNKNKIIVLLINNLEKEDFLPLLENTKFRENLLVIFDKSTTKHHEERYSDYITEDFKSHDKVIDRIKSWHAKNKQKDIVGIIGLDEEYQYALSKKIADIFRLKFYSQDTINQICNKYTQRIALKNNNVPIPVFKIIDKNNNISGIDFPNVLKIVSGISSNFVYLNKNINQLKNNIQDFKDKNPTLDNHLILEGFLDGDEYSCDFIILNQLKIKVLRVVKKIINKNNFPFFDGFYLFNPDYATFTCFKIHELENLCKKIAQTFHLDHGVCMVDFKYDKNQLFVIETTIRPGISQFIDLMADFYGYISIDILIQQKLKLDVYIKIPEATGLIFYITTDKIGTIKTFDTSSAEKNNTKLGIKSIVKYYIHGQTVEYEKNKFHKQITLGHVITKNINEENIHDTIKNIRKNITIVIES